MSEHSHYFLQAALFRGRRKGDTPNRRFAGDWCGQQWQSSPGTQWLRRYTHHHCEFAHTSFAQPSRGGARGAFRGPKILTWRYSDVNRWYVIRTEAHGTLLVSTFLSGVGSFLKKLEEARH